MKMPIIVGLKLSQDFDPIARLQLRIADVSRLDLFKIEASGRQATVGAFAR